MKNIAFALLLFALVPVTAFAPSQEAQLTQEQLVHAMRFLTTYQYSYAHDNKRFASLDEFLGWLQETGKLKEAPIGLSAESLKPYELQIITASDGKHYAISLLRTSDIPDRTTWCEPAAFTDDRGVIFLSLAIACEAPGRPSDE